MQWHGHQNDGLKAPPTHTIIPGCALCLLLQPNLLQFRPFMVCCVCTVLNSRPSKARMYFLLSIFCPSFVSTKLMQYSNMPSTKETNFSCLLCFVINQRPPKTKDQPILLCFFVLPILSPQTREKLWRMLTWWCEPCMDLWSFEIQLVTCTYCDVQTFIHSSNLFVRYFFITVLMVIKSLTSAQCCEPDLLQTLQVHPGPSLWWA